MKSLAQMENRLKELEAAIKETEARLPAHSVKPPVMIDLLALEDEYETLRQADPGAPGRRWPYLRQRMLRPNGIEGCLNRTGFF